MIVYPESLAALLKEPRPRAGRTRSASRVAAPGPPKNRPCPLSRQPAQASPVKIRCRSRRTLPSTRRQSTAS